jgi:hypothetical protein
MLDVPPGFYLHVAVLGLLDCITGFAGYVPGVLPVHFLQAATAWYDFLCAAGVRQNSLSLLLALGRRFLHLPREAPHTQDYGSGAAAGIMLSACHVPSTLEHLVFPLHTDTTHLGLKTLLLSCLCRPPNKASH